MILNIYFYDINIYVHDKKDTFLGVHYMRMKHEIYFTISICSFLVPGFF